MDSNDKTLEQKLKDAAHEIMIRINGKFRYDFEIWDNGRVEKCMQEYASLVSQSQSSEIERLKAENKLLLQREIAAQDKKLELVETLKNERAASSFLLDKLKAEISSLKSQLEAKAVDVEELNKKFFKFWDDNDKKTISNKDVFNFFLPHLQIGKSEAVESELENKIAKAYESLGCDLIIIGEIAAKHFGYL